MANSRLYVAQLDTRNMGPGSLGGYKEATVPSSFFEDLLSRSPSMISHKSQVAATCGLDIQIYFSKYKQGLASACRSGGEAGVVARIQSDPALLSNNNGAATFLTTDPVTGLSEYIVCGRAYVVQDRGQTPLSKSRVWGLVEMVNCLTDIYDLDPENMAHGRETLEEWAAEYKRGEWEPNSGVPLGMDLYSDRAIDTNSATKEFIGATPGPPPRPLPEEDGNRPLGATETLKLTVMLMEECSRKLLDAIDKDLYPDEGTEKIFGIEMEGPTRVRLCDLHKGRLVYSVWSEVYKFIIGHKGRGGRNEGALRQAKQAFVGDMTNAIMNERLGEQFQMWTEELLQSDFPLQTYSKEMARRGFDGRCYVNSDCKEHRGWVERIRINKANARA